MIWSRIWRNDDIWCRVRCRGNADIEFQISFPGSLITSWPCEGGWNCIHLWLLTKYLSQRETTMQKNQPLDPAKTLHDSRNLSLAWSRQVGPARAATRRSLVGFFFATLAVQRPDWRSTLDHFYLPFWTINHRWSYHIREYGKTNGRPNTSQYVDFCPFEKRVC